MYCFLRSFLLCLVLSYELQFGEAVELKLKQGEISGTVETTFSKRNKYFSFKGIPYALPPVGDLRFQPPVPLESWEGVYAAHEDKPTCLQGNARMRAGEKHGISGAEDCLYLNVYSPGLEDSLPIIVFDYTDNFRTSFNGTSTYAPDFFLEENVIVVTINHRLGIFGYLTTEDEVIPPNAGLKDFILGLKWIQENIKYFGGDPSRVTIMGSTGGAALADILLYSKKAKGLFSAVTMQSGTAMQSIFFPENPRKSAFALAEILDFNSNDSKELFELLKNANATELIMNDYKGIDAHDNNKQINVYPFSPMLEPESEDAVITDFPEKSNIVNDVPILIGFNSREGLDFSFHYIAEPRMILEIQKFLFNFPVRTNFRFNEETIIYQKALKEINEFYLRDGYFNTGNVLEYSVYVGDMFQSYATDYAVRKLAKEMTSEVYYYVFDFNGALNENFLHIARRARTSVKNKGATITDELCYLNLCSRIRKIYEEQQELLSEQREQKLIKKMVRMWSNFAKFRNPTPKNDHILKGFKWEPVDKESAQKNYLHIDKKLSMKKDPISERIEFWDNFIQKYSDLAVDGVVAEGELNEEKIVLIERNVEEERNVLDTNEETIELDFEDEGIKVVTIANPTPNETDGVVRIVEDYHEEL